MNFKVLKCVLTMFVLLWNMRGTATFVEYLTSLVTSVHLVETVKWCKCSQQVVFKLLKYVSKFFPSNNS